MSETDEITSLRADNERLRTALIVWRNAYKTGRNEPLVQAYEHSEALAVQPAPSESHLAPDHQAAMHGALRRSVSVVQPAPSPWRPIETAPKDGTEVLMVFVFEDGKTLHRVVRWDGSEMWPWREEYTGYREGEAKGWMPLPPAPEKEEA